MERLCTLAEGKGHLGILTPAGHPDDPPLQLQLDAAQLVIMNYVGRTAVGSALVETWETPEDTPADAKAAVLIMFAELHRFRGDDPDFASDRAQRWADTDLPPVVLGLLRRYGDPVLQ